jgi:acetoin:2,6-dichlorophenolindophenol oxidoreductase subunit beta
MTTKIVKKPPLVALLFCSRAASPPLPVAACSWPGVGVRPASAPASRLAGGPSCAVIDLRTIRPLDAETVARSVRRTGRLPVVDEDYRECGLSGEVAAAALESGVAPRYARVCLEQTIPYARHLEAAALPGVERNVAAARKLAG